MLVPKPSPRAARIKQLLDHSLRKSLGHALEQLLDHTLEQLLVHSPTQLQTLFPEYMPEPIPKTITRPIQSHTTMLAPRPIPGVRRSRYTTHTHTNWFVRLVPRWLARLFPGTPYPHTHTNRSFQLVADTPHTHTQTGLFQICMFQVHHTNASTNGFVWFALNRFVLFFPGAKHSLTHTNRLFVRRGPDTPHSLTQTNPFVRFAPNRFVRHGPDKSHAQTDRFDRFFPNRFVVYTGRPVFCRVRQGE